MKDKVSEIQIVPIKPKEGLVAFVSLIYDKAFYFSSIGLYTRPQGGYRLTYPTRKSPTSTLPLFNPINKEIADTIQHAVIQKYEELVTEYL